MQDNLGKAKIGIRVCRYSPLVVMLDCGKPHKILTAISVHTKVRKRVLRNCSYHEDKKINQQNAQINSGLIYY